MAAQATTRRATAGLCARRTRRPTAGERARRGSLDGGDRVRGRGYPGERAAGAVVVDRLLPLQFPLARLPPHAQRRHPLGRQLATTRRDDRLRGRPLPHDRERVVGPRRRADHRRLDRVRRLQGKPAAQAAERRR
eukprot:2790110-Prymnesium_polylepis.1